ncbi:hypothetical protein ACOSQ4_023027 [Xanthoceras sorbifolium]
MRYFEDEVTLKLYSIPLLVDANIKKSDKTLVLDGKNMTIELFSRSHKGNYKIATKVVAGLQREENIQHVHFIIASISITDFGSKNLVIVALDEHSPSPVYLPS